MTRLITHPGPAAAERVAVVPVGAVPIEAVLPAGGRLVDALAQLLQSRNLDSAALTLSGGGLGPFAYVIPALSPDGAQAAFYSSTYRPARESRLEFAAVTVGSRDGQPFFHCHALWTEADGRRGCGHVLPDETMISTPVNVSGAGIIGARFEAHPDAETGFKLFVPRATGRTIPPDTRPALALRLAPNQDLIETLERTGHAGGFRRAVVRGGVASIVGARLVEPSPHIDFATELLVRRGLIRCAPDAGAASELEIAIVDLHGVIACGHLITGANPILMTFEGVLEAA